MSTFPLLSSRHRETKVNGRRRLRTTVCTSLRRGSNMVFDIANAAAIIGLVVASVQLLIWMLLVLRACASRRNQVIVWAAEFIRACDQYIRKRRRSRTARNDEEIAILEPSSLLTGSTNAHTPNIKTNGHTSGVETQGPRTDGMRKKRKWDNECDRCYQYRKDRNVNLLHVEGKDCSDCTSEAGGVFCCTACIRAGLQCTFNRRAIADHVVVEASATVI